MTKDTLRPRYRAGRINPPLPLPEAVDRAPARTGMPVADNADVTVLLLLVPVVVVVVVSVGRSVSGSKPAACSKAWRKR